MVGASRVSGAYVVERSRRLRAVHAPAAVAEQHAIGQLAEPLAHALASGPRGPFLARHHGRP